MTRAKAKPVPHTYPSKYPPGTHWSVDIAWSILDIVPPGSVSDNARSLFAGMIAGNLVKERDRAARLAERGGNKQIAEAIRRGGIV